MAMRLKDAEAKFFGQLDKCWVERIDSYHKMSCEYILNDEQKGQYIHNLLWNDAARFYATAVEPHAATVQIAADMISAQCNSLVPQT